MSRSRRLRIPMAFSGVRPLCAAVAVCGLLGLAASAAAFDCNVNGVPDEDDIAAGSSTDCAGNGIPDACEVFPLQFEARSLAFGSTPIALAAAEGSGVAFLAAASLDAGSVTVYGDPGDATLRERRALGPGPRGEGLAALGEQMGAFDLGDVGQADHCSTSR